MIETKIEVSKPFLSLGYDIDNNVLTGDTTFAVALYSIGDEDPVDEEVTIEYDTDNFILSPNPFYASDRPLNITVSLALGADIPEGDFNFTFKLSNLTAPDKEMKASLVAKNDEPEPEPVYEYKLKYYILRSGYRFNIYENVLDSVELTPIEVNGTVEMQRQERKDLVEPVIATTLNITLDASLEMDLSDLYSEDERHFKAEALKDGEVVFLGYLLPDSIWKSFVADKWVLKIKASDGLSSLKNTAFAQDIPTIEGNPFKYYGRLTAFQILNICLNKTGLTLPIYINCQVAYYEWVGYDILSSIYLSTERYTQNDTEPMDCDAIVRSLMQIFNATLVQENGSWNVYRTMDLQPRMLWTKYTDGIFDQTVVKEFGDRLGSHINEVDKYHCGANQMESISASVQAFQISYEYGGSKNILANGGLIFEGTNLEAVNGIDMPGWNIPSPPDGVNRVAAGVRVGYNYGVRSTIYGPNADSIFLQLNQSIDILSGDSLTLRIKYRNTGFNSTHLRFAFGIVDSSSVLQYYHVNDGTWTTTGHMNEIPNYHQPNSSTYQGNGDAIFEVTLTVPSDGTLFLSIYRNKDAPALDGLMGIHSVSVSASENNIKSKDYTGRRLQKKSTAVKSNVTVFNGDSGSDLFVGTIFKNDSDTPTDGWNRYYMTEQGGGWVKNDYPEFKELLEINAEDNLKISPRPMTIFEGDFKGYISYMNYFTIDTFEVVENGSLIDKKFQFTKWVYSFDKDVTKMVAKEYSDNFFFGEENFKVTIKENFGSESKVTFIG